MKTILKDNEWVFETTNVHFNFLAFPTVFQPKFIFPSLITSGVKTSPQVV